MIESNDKFYQEKIAEKQGEIDRLKVENKALRTVILKIYEMLKGVLK